MSESKKSFEAIEYADFDDLFTGNPVHATKDVALSNGKVVQVRGMTRYELMLTRKGTEDIIVIERRMLAMCMTKPILTEPQIEKWQKSTGPMVIAPITEAIRELSGLVDDADKSDVREDGQ